MKRVLALMLLPLWLSPVEATAQAPAKAEECHLHSDRDDDAMPTAARRFLAWQPGGAILICSRPNEPDEATFYSPIVKAEKPVCYYTITPLFEQRNEYGREIYVLTSTSEKPPRRPKSSFMTVSDGDCPPHRDARYTPTKDISPGTFLQLFQIGQQLLTSIDAFDKLVPPGDAEKHQGRRRMLEGIISYPGHTRISGLGSEPALGLELEPGNKSSGPPPTAYFIRLQDSNRIRTLYLDVGPNGYHFLPAMGFVHYR